ncbi:hypothetical protein BC939DRAFT_480617 [Gamsiella multidivaricata]|uniref:uncharacterized protein n=1 Tax=Gamsiella multidivaricata TaxID=101098 RepID=UPI0022207C41|nr:uncharacterized protein BC939DRAFT_480617 [Gamsiella multidivaricata]KAG0364086.1 hypothetical protein BGZ54_007856 [Gamsiella multidivaricata]KAI7818183.1 hypothetical protein BC939DRAFT_480617 [Gamsiella multidivaricata]
MKLVSSLSLVAALVVSVCSASHLDSCPENDSLFDVYSASINPSSVDPSKEICLSIKGELKTDLPLEGSMIKFTVEQPRVLSKDWQVGVYSSLRFPQGTQLPVSGGGDRELNACFYLPPEFQYTQNGAELLISAEITSRDKDDDDVSVVCVTGAARVSRG